MRSLIQRATPTTTATLPPHTASPRPAAALIPPSAFAARTMPRFTAARAWSLIPAAPRSTSASGAISTTANGSAATRPLALISLAVAILLQECHRGGASLVEEPIESTAPPIVNTTLGAVAGERRGDVTFYRSIPFAAPPTKDNRYRAPQPGIPWSGVRSALIPNRQCPQLLILGDEDCLLLHVAVPDECTPTSPCAVLFWIYGGAFVLGSDEEFGYYDPGRAGPHAAGHRRRLQLSPRLARLLGPQGVGQREPDRHRRELGHARPAGGYAVDKEQCGPLWR